MGEGLNRANIFAEELLWYSLIWYKEQNHKESGPNKHNEYLGLIVRVFQNSLYTIYIAAILKR